MSAEIIIIIVGAILILLALIKNLISTKLRIPMGMLGVLLLIYGGYSYGGINLQGQIEQVDVGNKLQVNLPIERVQVISPLEGDAVECRILTMGVYPETLNKDIWVVLKPSNNKYYPQSDHTNTSFKRNGEWQVITRFGGDQEEAYDIIVYETDATASQFFSTTIQNWKDALSYPGLEIGEIPTGAREVDRIAVSLKENCRGVF
ncbi:MAG: hypothetical protein KJP00_09625 [Bacteroidia bacterium]|nr:hypothetical protein [Bacteroidia bacterium]